MEPVIPILAIFFFLAYFHKNVRSFLATPGCQTIMSGLAPTSDIGKTVKDKLGRLATVLTVWGTFTFILFLLLPTWWDGWTENDRFFWGSQLLFITLLSLGVMFTGTKHKPIIVILSIALIILGLKSFSQQFGENEQQKEAGNMQQTSGVWKTLKPTIAKPGKWTKVVIPTRNGYDIRISCHTNGFIKSNAVKATPCGPNITTSIGTPPVGRGHKYYLFKPFKNTEMEVTISVKYL